MEHVNPLAPESLLFETYSEELAYMVEEKTDETETKRLTILEAEEIESVYGLPVFEEEERAFYF